MRSLHDLSVPDDDDPTGEFILYLPGVWNVMPIDTARNYTLLFATISNNKEANSLSTVE